MMQKKYLVNKELLEELCRRIQAHKHPVQVQCVISDDNKIREDMTEVVFFYKDNFNLAKFIDHTITEFYSLT